jgi:hypothetical protein
MNDPETIPIASAVLDYATFDADGLPPWVAEAEARIQQRAKPTSIRPFFRNADQAVKYFAKSMRRRFGLQQIGDVCTACGASHCATAVSAEWKVRIRDKFTTFRLTNKPPEKTFLIYHAICADCFTRWNRSLLRRDRIRKTLVALRWVAIASIWAAIVVGARVRVRTSFPAESWLWLTYFIIITSSGLVYRWSARRGVPQGIVDALPPKLELVRVVEFDLRERLLIASAAQPEHA